MFGFLKTAAFDTTFSVILGIGIMALFKPMCNGTECFIKKAPPYDEVNNSVYQLGEVCYKFRATPVKCPDSGIIEPFERFVQ
jgi:hypothetical protein